MVRTQRDPRSKARVTRLHDESPVSVSREE
jgi:hypothetical protein